MLSFSFRHCRQKRRQSRAEKRNIILVVMQTDSVKATRRLAVLAMEYAQIVYFL